MPKSRSGKLKLVSIRAHGFDGASIVSTDNGSLIAAFSKNTVLPKGLLLSCEFIAEELGDDEIYFDIRAKAVDSGGEHSVQLSEPAARVYHIGSIADYDVNGDGEVNAVDLVRLMRIIAGAVSGERGDINGDRSDRYSRSGAAAARDRRRYMTRCSSYRFLLSRQSG